jgi:glycosyltransferase involved in cell wall biosynthesis
MIAKKRVTLVTRVRFWQLGAGHRERIRVLVGWLQHGTELTVVFLGDEQTADREILASVGLAQLRLECLGRDRNQTNEEYLDLFRYFLAQHPCDVCIVAGLPLTYLLKAIPKSTKIMLDMIDMISDRATSFHKYGAEHRSMSRKDEFRIFAHYDTIIAIQHRDFRRVRRSLGDARAVLAPHPTIYPQQQLRPVATRVGFVASEYPPNIDAINWFIREVWPSVQRPGVELRVFGNVYRKLSKTQPEGVVLYGFAPSLEQVYSNEIDVVINPVRFGSGLKIKNIEALGNGLPLITTSHGALGIEKGKGVAFSVADTPEAYARELTRLLDSYDERVALGNAAYCFAQDHFSQSACFRPLLAEIYRPKT